MEARRTALVLKIEARIHLERAVSGTIMVQGPVT